MHEITLQSLLEPLKEPGVLRKVLPSLMIQGVALFAVVLQSQAFLNRFNQLTSVVDASEKGDDAFLNAGLVCMLSFVLCDFSRILFSENNQTNAACFSSEMYTFYCEKSASLDNFEEDFDESLLKKNKKDTEDLIISGTEIALNLSILGGAVYHATGLSRDIVLAYCLMRSVLTLAYKPERLQGLPLIQSDIVNENAVTQYGQGFFHRTQQVITAYSNLSPSTRAGLVMTLGAFFSGLQAPGHLALSVQVLGAVEWGCEHLSAFMKTQAEISERFKPS